MIYLIVGEESLITKETKELLKKYNSESIIKYDLEETSITTVIDDINTINLFSDLKIIICNNLNKIDNDQVLISYLNNQNNNILIFTETNKLDEKKSSIKELKKVAKVIDTTSINLSNYIKESFSEYTISSLTISLLKDYCNNDFNRLCEEINKLKMYKLDDKIILDEDVKKIVIKSLDKNIFDLTNAINKNDKTKIFEIYNDLKNNNEDELKILVILANNYRLLYQIKVLISNCSDEGCIAKLNIHPYRFKILKGQSYSFSYDELINYLKKLSDIDIKIKSGTIDKNLAMELFLAEI